MKHVGDEDKKLYHKVLLSQPYGPSQHSKRGMYVVYY